MAEAIHIFRREAMATVFEIRVAGGGATYAGQAAQAAFAVVERMERLLSRFDSTSEISRINALRPGEVARVCPEVFDCLEQALSLQLLTQGAFDPAFGTAGAARGQLLMDRQALLVGVEGGPVPLDLGAIGKGFAIDRAAEELQAWDIAQALLIAGGSSLKALAGPAHQPAAGWEVGLGGTEPARRLRLEYAALGSSGTAVKGAHIVDPRTGSPAAAAHRTWAAAPTAAAADALSTAWMVLAIPEIDAICSRDPEIGAIVQAAASGGDLWCTGKLKFAG